MHKLISFVISESPKVKKGAELEQKPIQSAPQYYESSIPKQFESAKEKLKIGDWEVEFSIRSYRPDNLLVEAAVEVEDVFSEETFKLREELINGCQKISQKRGGKPELSEEYSIALVSGYQGDPEQFLTKSEAMAAFLKSEREPLDEKEIEYTLSAQIKYARNDLVIVDWDGAFVFDTTGEIDDIIDLFQVANLQLLRYRVLDRDLDERLGRVTKFANVSNRKNMLLNRRSLTKEFREIIETRRRSIVDFEAIDRDIKLIGDWYSARLYDLASKKYKLSDWQKTVHSKLESLEDIYDIVAENFSITSHELLELIQIILFFVLQVGWFVLIILEFFYYTK